MADVRYFNDETQLYQIREIKAAEFDALFPGQTAIRWSAGYRLIGRPVGTESTYDRVAKCWSLDGFLPAQRNVTYKARPSKHECDARCINATGRTMQCECSCGGKNHGRGSSIKCETA